MDSPTGLGICISSSPGSMMMETDRNFRRCTCVCKSKLCKQITKCFNSINDVRGLFFTVPPDDVQRKGDLKRFKNKRMLEHLRISGDDVEATQSFDVRDQSASVTPSQGTRTQKSVQTRSTKYVAYHHFDPVILQQYIVDDGETTIDLIPESFLRDCNLLGNGYTDEDRFRGEVNGYDENVYAPVPSYKHAARDYKLASGRYRLNLLIKACGERHRGETFLATRSEVAANEVQNLQLVDELPHMDINNVEHLQRAVCLLKDENDALKQKINQLEDKIKADRLIYRGTNQAIEQFVQEGRGGLHRLSISSDDYHRKHPSAAKQLFGFEDRRKDNAVSGWELTKQFILDNWGVKHEEPTINNKYDASRRSLKLSRFEQILITMMFFSYAYDYDHISLIFGVHHRNTIGRTIKGWAPHFREVGYHHARLPLTKKFLDEAYPESYAELNFTNPVATIIDGTDVGCQTVRVDRYINVVQHSNKIHASSVRGITWSTPMGMVHEFTDPFFGRASEKALVKVWTSQGRFCDLPAKYLVSGDKGFDGT